MFRMKYAQVRKVSVIFVFDVILRRTHWQIEDICFYKKYFIKSTLREYKNY